MISLMFQFCVPYFFTNLGMSYLFRDSFTSGKSFTMSMFDTLLYQSYNKSYLPELLKLMLGLTYADGSGRLGIYRITTMEESSMTYGEIYKKLSSFSTCISDSRDSKSPRKSHSQNANQKSYIPIGLYRFRHNIRHNVHHWLMKTNKNKEDRKKKEMRITSFSYSQILKEDSTKSERQLIDEYLEKRSKELFGDSFKKDFENYLGSHYDSKSGYVILSPKADLPLVRGDIIYVLKNARSTLFMDV